MTSNKLLAKKVVKFLATKQFLEGRKGIGPTSITWSSPLMGPVGGRDSLSCLGSLGNPQLVGLRSLSVPSGKLMNSVVEASESHGISVVWIHPQRDLIQLFSRGRIG